MATKLVVGENDLQTVNPCLSLEWDYKKNEGLRPEMVTSGSSKKVHWKGNCGHEWEATIASRNSGVGCPLCAKSRRGEAISKAARKRSGDLTESNPILAAEWHPSKNGALTPKDVTAGSHVKVWWKGKCSHEWQAAVKSRNHGNGCPICSCSVVVAGVNDLKTKNPRLADEWNETRNLLSSESISSGSSRMVWWICEKGHEWQATPKSRSRGNGCPYCAGKKILPKFNDLITICPDVAKEWHPLLNKKLCPESISANSHIKVWWKCQNGHEWQASPNHRASKGRGCPYCCANPQVIPGVNDIMTVNPELAKEWNYHKNGYLTPDKVTAKSSKVVWWKCTLGHEWRTSTNHRANGSGCPKCAQGKQTSFPEQAIYYYVLQTYPDAENRYTDLFDNRMELDVYIPSIKVGIEYDGAAYHHNKEQKEREKYLICKEAGIKLIRIREDIENEECDSSDNLILIKNGLEEGIKKLSDYGIITKDVNLERDRNKIDANYRNSLIENSLQQKYPLISAEWNFQKNGEIAPDMFAARSNRTVWWRCAHGHEWQAKIDSRVRGTGCPYCSNNKILKGFNDLATLRPDLMNEWDYEKNTECDPTKVSKGSGIKAWWKCENGHSWYAEISSRNKGHGCPYCSGNKRV